MRGRTPPLAPDEQPHDVTIYIVLNDFAQLGRAYVETDEAKADEETVSAISAAASTPTPYEWWLLTLPRNGVVMSRRTLHAQCLTAKRGKLT